MSEQTDFYPAYFTTRFRVSPPVPVWPGQFVIVTAYATTGERWTDEQNARANAQLLQHIESLGKWFYPVTGYDPTTGHAERGWAIDGPPSLGLELGRAFLQDAIFVVEADKLSVCACSTGKYAEVGSFSTRVDVEVPNFPNFNE
jgi:hypothetical protein